MTASALSTRRADARQDPMQKTIVLLNARAGTLIDRGADGLRRDLRQALGDDVDVRLLRPRQMSRAVSEAARGPFGTVIIGGGDGSVSYAVNKLAGSDKVLGVLPCGTLNLLARDLGMPVDLGAALKALATATPRRIDVASINGRAFHSLSGLGFFSQMARAREETRGHPLGRFLGVGLAAVRALRRAGRFDLAIAVDGRVDRVEALAVLVTNNRFTADWRRPRLDAGLLELHIAEDAGAIGRLKASADLLTGGWRDNPGIRSFTAREVTIGQARRRIWTATDGELSREQVPLRYALRPQALTVLAPAGNPDGA
jgi:diacylglycerol kinase family enzyme